jgi:hypothetical protein
MCEFLSFFEEERMKVATLSHTLNKILRRFRLGDFKSGPIGINQIISVLTWEKKDQIIRRLT